MRAFIASFFFCALCSLAYGQGDSVRTTSGHLLAATLDDNGDTIPYVSMRPYYIWARRSFPSKKEEKRYTRLQQKVMKVYPYAKKANELLVKYSKELEGVEDRKVIKSYYRRIEKELWAEYGEEIKNLSISEGRILIKLIDRETDRTSYELVKELRSGFTAFVFQGMARLFGHNLKAEYDSQAEDKYIEEIVTAIEMNQI